MLHGSFVSKMISVFIGFAICFLVELLLSLALIYRDVKPSKPDEINIMSEHLGQTYFWERVFAVVFDAFQVGLSIAGITATVCVLRSVCKIYWLDMAIRCNLQLFTGA